MEGLAGQIVRFDKKDSFVECLKVVKNLVGEHRKVKLIEVGSQKEKTGHTLGEYCHYIEHRTGDYRIFNCISLEFSSYSLSPLVMAPLAVRQIDWIDVFWPIYRRARGDYPQVQKYCLISMKGSYTDFHVDFGGTSVWYHVLWGEKIFYLIPPTESNLRKYLQWTCSRTQDSQFFGDLVKRDCKMLKLYAGQTLFIPGGWIHGVYTPEDSLVFGGNFLHSANLLRQLQIYVVEQKTNVDKYQRFPNFRQVHWYFLCGLFPHVRNNCEKLTQDEVDGNDCIALYARSLSNPQIFMQLPFLIKTCELWISSFESDNEKQIFEQQTFSIEHTPSSLLSSWWDLLILVGNQLDSSDKSTRYVDHVNHFKNLKPQWFDIIAATLDFGVEAKMSNDEEPSDDVSINEHEELSSHIQAYDTQSLEEGEEGQVFVEGSVDVDSYSQGHSSTKRKKKSSFDSSENGDESNSDIEEKEEEDWEGSGDESDVEGIEEEYIIEKDEMSRSVRQQNVGFEPKKHSISKTTEKRKRASSSHTARSSLLKKLK